MDILPDEPAENPDQPACEKDRQVRKIRQLFGVLSVCFIVLTQIFLYTTPINDAVFTPNGFLLSLLGLGVFILSQCIPIPQRAARIRWLDPASAGVRIAAAVVFAALATFAMVSFQRYGRVNYMPVLSLWVISGMLYLFSFPLPLPDFRGIAARVKAHRGELLVLLFITLVAAALRFYHLGAVPRVINGDEGMIGLVAQSVNGHVGARGLDIAAEGVSVLGLALPPLELLRVALTTADARPLWDRVAGTRVQYRTRGAAPTAAVSPR